MKKPRAFMLIAALMLISIMMVMGMGLLGSRASRNQGVYLAAQAARARALAWAGLEATRVKFSKDLNFPPPAEIGQNAVELTERVYDLDGTFVGTYTTTIESTWRQSPYSILRISSLGKVGPVDAPDARYKIVGELDVSETLRSDPAQPNPKYFQWVVWSDEGVY